MSDVHLDPDSFDDDEPTQVGPPPAARSGPDLDFVLAGAPDRTTHADDARKTMLEVHQTWGDTLLDTVHAHGGEISGGEATGQRWKLLGAEIAWVPKPLALVLPFAPPMLSEVDTRPLADLALAGPGIPSHGTVPLFVQGVDGWEARIREGWEAVLDAGGELFDLEALLGSGQATRRDDGSAAIRVPEGGQLSVGIGDIALHARLVPAAKKAAAGSLLDRLDLVFLGLVALMGFLGACFGVLIAALPGAPTDSAMDYEELARMVQPVMVPETPPEVLDREMGASEERAKRAEGKRGEEVAKNEPGAGAKAAPSDKEVAMEAGLLGFLNTQGYDAGVGGGVESSMLDGIGLLHGKGVAQGNGGLGARGDKLGGGGTIDGIGGIGVGCPPGARCKGFGNGPGTGKWGKRIGDPVVRSEPPLVLGNVDRAAIDAVIKRNLPKFKYCYQRQLQRTPELAGKVVNRFVIAGDGSVSKSETKISTLNAAVDSCVIKTMSRLHFPAPKGGGMAIISYPFTFSAN